MENKQTAVEWLIEQMMYQMAIRIENTTIGCELFEQAKAMEKQQIMDAHEQAYIKMNLSFSAADRAEQFYEETYKK